MRSALSEMPDFRHCLRPGCPSGQLHNSGTEGNIFICSACGFKVCTVHDAAMHTGETCAQYDQRIRDQQRGYKKSEKTIKDTTKRCPGRKCGVPIEKNDGCDHMTCTYSHIELLRKILTIIRQADVADFSSAGYVLLHMMARVGFGRSVIVRMLAIVLIINDTWLETRMLVQLLFMHTRERTPGIPRGTRCLGHV